MKPEFNEFSFAFSVISEIVNSNFYGKNMGVPFIPTLQDESKYGNITKKIILDLIFVQIIRLISITY